ncbi:hypothetical protein [Hymenobacter terrestris]|uniref:SMI1/KNR4 family protein n=1 Tax=Hymenobacter terrestris TaxID=2748310 RepID=A0ABX2Q694_9BACT|nr:hypothetical protein [Hymenobacter terrestris]NVO86398.1 hypothetical protein [Hymenobacter terrestris]
MDQLNARAAFWNTHGIQLGQPAPERLTPITYREVADELGLAYTPDFDNAAIHRAYGGWPPHLGTSCALELARLPQLVSVLGAQTATYFFGSVDEGNYRWDADGMPVDWLEQGAAVDLLDLVAEGIGWPTYLFAANHDWCFYQGEDQWLAIGCSAVLAQALQAQPALEILPLQ